MFRSCHLPFLRRLARGMVVAAICLSLGMQWAALQGIAWTGMLIHFSKEGSLMAAVEKTFDGEHPCALCKAVEEGKRKSQDTTAKAPLKKMEAALTVKLSPLIAPAPERMAYAALDERGTPRLALPQGKPPRVRAA